LATEEAKKDGFDPLVRTNVPFGGIISEFKQRIPHLKSDITDSFNAMCLAATIFIFFAALSGAIAFGGLMGTDMEHLRKLFGRPSQNRTDQSRLYWT
jgi:hypothetical protein